MHGSDGSSNVKSVFKKKVEKRSVHCYRRLDGWCCSRTETPVHTQTGMNSGDQSALARHVVQTTTGVESGIGTEGYDAADGSDAEGMTLLISVRRDLIGKADGNDADFFQTL
jgi:hypothetical protein